MKRLAGTAILHRLLQDALRERGLEWVMQSICTGEPGTSAQIQCHEATDREDIQPSAEALLAAYIQALKMMWGEQPGT